MAASHGRVGHREQATQGSRRSVRPVGGVTLYDPRTTNSSPPTRATVPPGGEIGERQSQMLRSTFPDPITCRARMPVVPRRPLALAAALFLIGSLASFAWLAVTSVDGYDWPEASVVPIDGEPHTVELGAIRTAMLWTYEAEATPNCTIEDASTGEPLHLDAVHDYRRPGGSAGEYVATSTFEPGSGAIEVACSGLDSSSGSFVAVENAPRLPPFLAGYGMAIAIPLTLALAGLATLIAAAVRRWTGNSPVSGPNQADAFRR
jgi:hypothetical protein